MQSNVNSTPLFFPSVLLLFLVKKKKKSTWMTHTSLQSPHSLPFFFCCLKNFFLMTYPLSARRKHSAAKQKELGWSYYVPSVCGCSNCGPDLVNAAFSPTSGVELPTGHFPPPPKQLPSSLSFLFFFSSGFLFLASDR